jgi:hypothetical protein
MDSAPEDPTIGAARWPCLGGNEAKWLRRTAWESSLAQWPLQPLSPWRVSGPWPTAAKGHLFSSAAPPHAAWEFPTVGTCTCRLRMPCLPELQCYVLLELLPAYTNGQVVKVATLQNRPRPSRDLFLNLLFPFNPTPSLSLFVSRAGFGFLSIIVLEEATAYPPCSRSVSPPASLPPSPPTSRPIPTSPS